MVSKNSYRDLAVLIESSQDMRNSMKEALEKAGFKEVQVAGSVEEAWSLLSREKSPDWIVSSYYNDKNYNTSQLIGLLVQQPGLKNTMFSLLVTEEEYKHLPSAFEMSVLSVHKKPIIPEALSDQLKTMAERLEGGELALKIASENLREHFTITQNKNGLLRLETALFDCLPPTSESYAFLAKAQFEAGEFEAARSTIIKAKHTMTEENDTIKAIGTKLAEKGEKYSTVGAPLSEILNLKSILVIESDESQALIIKKSLESLTIESVHIAATADESETWLQQNLNSVSMIIATWKMPGITGAGLIQRLQSIEGLVAVPIIIVTSGLEKHDKLLLREMGIAGTLGKPIKEEDLKRVVLSEANRHLATNEAQTIVRRFQNAVRNNRLKLAKQLFSKLSNLQDVSPKLVAICEAEILYEDGEYVKCRDLATVCFRKYGEDVVILNLLGKSYMKLGDHMSALKCLNRAHLLSPQNLDRLCSLAEAQSEIGEDEAAKSAINIAEKVDKNSKKVQATKASIAINAGRLDDAKHVLERSPVVRNMVAYMNNRAVSLVVQGRVEGSLELYRNALAALPEKNEKERWVLCYNYALACIRMEKLGEAMNTLKNIDIVKTDPLYLKISSLRKRLQVAIASGETMKLNFTDHEKKVGKEDGIPLALHCKPGELKLHHIFFAEDLASKEFLKAMTTIPKISQRGHHELTDAS